MSIQEINRKMKKNVRQFQGWITGETLLGNLTAHRGAVYASAAQHFSAQLGRLMDAAEEESKVAGVKKYAEGEALEELDEKTLELEARTVSRITGISRKTEAEISSVSAEEIRELDE